MSFTCANLALRREAYRIAIDRLRYVDIDLQHPLRMAGAKLRYDLHQGRLDPGVSLIQKPFSQDALASRVRKILSGA